MGGLFAVRSACVFDVVAHRLQCGLLQVAGGAREAARARGEASLLWYGSREIATRAMAGALEGCSAALCWHRERD